MRLIAIFLFSVFCFAGTVFAECTVATADSPRFVNVRLGMSAAETNSALSGLVKVKVKNDEQYSYFKSYLKKGKAKGTLAGARAFYLRFFEQRLYQSEIFYHTDYRWNDLETFVRDYSAENGFAFDNWVFKNGYAKAECVGFTIKADYILNPHIEITDEAAKEKVESKK